MRRRGYKERAVNPSLIINHMASASEVIKDTTRKANSFLGRKTNGSVKDSGLKAAALIGISYVGGNLAAALIGKPSFLIGAGLTFAGCYKEDNHWLAHLGLGMMTAPTPKGETIKDRLIEVKDDFLSKTYLDKVIPSKSKSGSGKRLINTPSEETTDGFGSVNDNLNVLNQVEQQLINSAITTQNRQSSTNSMQGYESEMNGTDDMDLSML
ncbi:hypothetical protein [Flavobacterium filum]|uniref:hypothetical protein n=1 Tax=Flavobacterium filum TaxID=370974 RepID=UPI0023F50E7D|nr:hypothetical protein [Flavobacterium filum]